MNNANQRPVCDRMTLLIAAAVDGVIAPDEERQLDEHLQACELCTETLLAMTAGALDVDPADRGRDAAGIGERADIDPPGHENLARDPTPEPREDVSMFANYVGAKTQKRRKWVTVLITTSVAVHAAIVLVLLIRSFWVIDLLTPPKRDLAVAVAPPPPPPPPPPKASKKKKIENKNVKKVKPMDTTQPVEAKEDEPEVEIEYEDEGSEDGVEGGQAGGIPLGVVGGQLEGVPGGSITAPPPPPPPPPKPKIVPQQAVQANRVAGEAQIVPDDGTKLQIKRDGKTQVITTVKMCLSASGSVTDTQVVKSSGYPGYDRKITGKMRQWQYKPFVVNGKPVPVCTAVTFVYRQTD